MESIGVVVKNNIINERETDVEEIIKEPTNFINETTEFKNNFQTYLKKNIEDIHKQLGEIRGMVRRLVSNDELKK